MLSIEGVYLYVCVCVTLGIMMKLSNILNVEMMRSIIIYSCEVTDY